MPFRTPTPPPPTKKRKRGTEKPKRRSSDIKRPESFVEMRTRMKASRSLSVCQLLLKHYGEKIQEMIHLERPLVLEDFDQTKTSVYKCYPAGRGGMRAFQKLANHWRVEVPLTVSGYCCPLKGGLRHQPSDRASILLVEGTAKSRPTMHAFSTKHHYGGSIYFKCRDHDDLGRPIAVSLEEESLKTRAIRICDHRMMCDELIELLNWRRYVPAQSE